MTEERSIGYEEGYQAGWNAALDAKATPSADVQLLTDEELEEIIAAKSGYGGTNLNAIIRATEQAVRQKVGLK